MHEQGSQQTQLSAEPMHVTPQKKSLRNFTSFSSSLPDYYTGEEKKTWLLQIVAEQVQYFNGCSLHTHNNHWKKSAE